MAEAWWRDSDYELFDRMKRENAALREALREAIAAVRRAHEARERYAAWVPCGCPWCTDTPDNPNDSN